MQRRSPLAAAAQVALVGLYVALVALLLVWAVWLLATDDPDGGRHPAGGVMLVAGVLLGVAGFVAARRPRG